MPRSSREVTAEAIREIDHRFARIEVLLDDIKRIIIDLADGQNQHRSHVRDQVDRLGTRVLALEHRASANGGE